MIGEPTYTALKGRMAPGFNEHMPELQLSFVFSLLHSVTNEKHYEKCFYNQSSHYGKYNWFLLQM